MAVRSVLRKMPVIGLGSPPIAPVRALLPAAGSRLMSHGAPEGQRIQPLAQQLESIGRQVAEQQGRRLESIDIKFAELHAEYDKKHAEFHAKWAEGERIAAEKFDKTIEMIQREAAAGEVYYGEVIRRNDEVRSRYMKKFGIVEKTCDVLDVAFPAAALLVWMYTM